MRKGYSVALASLFCFSTISFAGNQEGNWTFTLGDGYYRFASKRHIDNTGVAYGELAYNLTPHWGVESMLGFFTTDSRLAIDNGKEVNGSLFTLDAIYHFSPYCCFEPYVAAGPGVISMNPNGTNANTEGNINAAIGTQYFFSKTIALRVEFRDFYTMVGGKNDYFLNGGVSFLF